MPKRLNSCEFSYFESQLRNFKTRQRSSSSLARQASMGGYDLSPVLPELFVEVVTLTAVGAGAHALTEWTRAAFAFNPSRDIGKRRTTVLATHGIQLEGSRFWVTHRRKTYGPFDYEWSSDFCGVVMLYDGQPFGEYCSLDELYADLKPYSLPMSVVRVTSIVMGCVLFGILNGLCETERSRLVEARLHQYGFERFLVVR